MSTQVSTSEADDRAHIVKILASQAEAWNGADAASFAERYREDGSFTNIAGTRVYGKAPFIEIHAHIFKTVFAGSHITFEVDRINFLRPDVAVVDIDATLKHVHGSPLASSLPSEGTIRSKLQEVWTKDDDHWEIAAFHNVAVAEMPSQ